MEWFTKLACPFRFWAEWWRYWFYNDVCYFIIIFYVSVYTISCRNNASNFNFSSFSDWKLNLVGAYLKKICYYITILLTSIFLKLGFIINYYNHIYCMEFYLPNALVYCNNTNIQCINQFTSTKTYLYIFVQMAFLM